MRESAGFSLRPYRLKPELQRPQAGSPVDYVDRGQKVSHYRGEN